MKTELKPTETIETIWQQRTDLFIETINLNPTPRDINDWRMILKLTAPDHPFYGSPRSFKHIASRIASYNERLHRCALWAICVPFDCFFPSSWEMRNYGFHSCYNQFEKDMEAIRLELQDKESQHTLLHLTNHLFFFITALIQQAQTVLATFDHPQFKDWKGEILLSQYLETLRVYALGGNRPNMPLDFFESVQTTILQILEKKFKVNLKRPTC